MYEVPLSPRRETYLAVDQTHKIYVYEYGNPDGIPALFCHGGPGAGSSPKHARYFDPKHYRIILFDQRGCGKSTPGGCLENNNTNALLTDMEKIRQALQVNKWVIFGGSWGTTLALLYAEAYPQNVLGLVLRGVFLSREEDCNIFYREKSPAALCNPKEWRAFKKNLANLLAEQQLPSLDNHIDNLLALLKFPDIKIAKQAADILFKWEEKICMLSPPEEQPPSDVDPRSIINAALIEVTYTKEKCYLAENQILDNIKKLAGIPVYIVQGKVDLVCPQEQAFALFTELEKLPSDIKYTECPAGHTGTEPTLIDAAIEALDTLAMRLRLEIYLAKEEDVNRIINIGKQTHREAYPDLDNGEEIRDYRFGKKFLEETYFNELKSGKVIYYLVKDQTEIVGFAKLIFENNEAQLDKLYLMKDYQRKHIGSTLLQKCFQDALERNIKKMSLALNRQNPAIGFYKKYGFLGTGRFVTAIPSTVEKTAEILQCDDVSQYLSFALK